jgi:hypothetical protein
MTPLRTSVPQLDALKRGIGYTALYVTFVEVAYTGLKDWRSGSFQGFTQLWVYPAAGFGGVYLFEQLHDKIRKEPTWFRACVYAMGFLMMEGFLGGLTLSTVGHCPWEYNIHSLAVLKNTVNLAYTPLWGIVGLLGEKVHDFFISFNMVDKSESEKIEAVRVKPDLGNRKRQVISTIFFLSLVGVYKFTSNKNTSLRVQKFGQQFLVSSQ